MQLLHHHRICSPTSASTIWQLRNTHIKTSQLHPKHKLLQKKNLTQLHQAEQPWSAQTVQKSHVTMACNHDLAPRPGQSSVALQLLQSEGSTITAPATDSFLHGSPQQHPPHAEPHCSSLRLTCKLIYQHMSNMLGAVSKHTPDEQHQPLNKLWELFPFSLTKIVSINLYTAPVILQLLSFPFSGANNASSLLEFPRESQKCTRFHWRCGNTCTWSCSARASHWHSHI